MLKITRDAMDAVLKENIKLGTFGIIKHQSDLEQRLAFEKPLFFAFTTAGSSKLREFPGYAWRLIRGGFTSGAYLTFRMLEMQAKMNKEELPEIKEEDILKVNSHAELQTLIHSDDAKMKELERIHHNNPEYGNYLIRYVKQQAPAKIVLIGFPLGAISTYSLYEEAYSRTKSN